MVSKYKFRKLPHFVGEMRIPRFTQKYTGCAIFKVGMYTRHNFGNNEMPFIIKFHFYLNSSFAK